MKGNVGLSMICTLGLLLAAAPIHGQLHVTDAGKDLTAGAESFGSNLPKEESGNGFPVIPVVGGAVVILAGGAWVVMQRRRRS